MTHPEDVNKVLTDGLVICQKRVYAEKCKKEPTRYLKCHGWGHMSYDCQQPFSTCGTCASHHRTSDCTNRGRPRCVSCHMDGHLSWDWQCPTFLNKCHDMDTRMTENQMLYYPTANSWTHTLQPPKPTPPALVPSQTQLHSQFGAMGANRPAAGSQPWLYRQATLNFLLSWRAPQWHDAPSSTGPLREAGASNEAEGLPPSHIV